MSASVELMERGLSGVERIGVERLRQVEKEDWSSAHDDAHTSGCLASAGACYALFAASFGDTNGTWKRIYSERAEELWPFDKDPWWKPSSDPIRNLEKAGALIAAEIDRLMRKEAGER